jgi:hypothetical protein
VSGNSCVRRTPRFGPRVTLGDRRFRHDAALDPRRLRLADIDGCGHAAFVSLSWIGSDGVREPQRQRPGRPGHQPAAARDRAPRRHVIDPLGTGTACLVRGSSLPADRDRPVARGELTAASSHGGSSGCLRRLPRQASRTVVRLTQCSGNGRREVHGVPAADLAGCCERRPL